MKEARKRKENEKKGKRMRTRASETETYKERSCLTGTSDADVSCSCSQIREAKLPDGRKQRMRLSVTFEQGRGSETEHEELTVLIRNIKALVVCHVVMSVLFFF